MACARVNFRPIAWHRASPGSWLGHPVVVPCCRGDAARSTCLCAEQLFINNNKDSCDGDRAEGQNRFQYSNNNITIYYYYYNSFVFVRTALVHFAVYALVYCAIVHGSPHTSIIIILLYWNFWIDFPFFRRCCPVPRSSHETNATVDRPHRRRRRRRLSILRSAVAPCGRRTLWTAVPWWTRSTTSSGGPGARRRWCTSRRPTPMTCTLMSESSSCSCSSRTTWAHIGWSHGFSSTSTPAYLSMSECNV